MKLVKGFAGKEQIFVGYLHWCPGCKGVHLIHTETDNHCNARWAFDGNVESPTFTPSINIVGHCHYFIRAGQIQFCADSSHELKGTTVELPDMPEGWGEPEKV